MDLIFQQELPQQYTPRMDIKQPQDVARCFNFGAMEIFSIYVNIVRYAKLSECDDNYCEFYVIFVNCM